MNSNPYILPAVVVCVAALVISAAWVWLSLGRQAATGRHARQRAASAEAEQFAAELRGDPEPPEEEPIAYGAHHAGDPVGCDASYDHPGWWDEEPPQPPAVEVLTGPGTRIPYTSAATIGTLARMRDALLPDAWRPEPAEVTFTPADPDATMTDLPAVDGAPRYLAAPQ